MNQTNGSTAKTSEFKVTQSTADQKAKIASIHEMDATVGAAACLALRSPSHKHLFVTDFEWLIIPPISLRQFKLFRQKDTHNPLAFMSWAFVSEAIEKRLLSGNTKLAPQEWKSGDRAWLIDVISPYASAQEFLKQLAETTFKDKEIKLLQAQKNGGFEGKLLRDVLKDAQEIAEKIKSKKTQKLADKDKNP